MPLSSLLRYPPPPAAKLLLRAGQIKLKVNEAVMLMEAGSGREECSFLSQLKEREVAAPDSEREISGGEFIFSCP